MKNTFWKFFFSSPGRWVPVIIATLIGIAMLITMYCTGMFGSIEAIFALIPVAVIAISWAIAIDLYNRNR